MKRSGKMSIMDAKAVREKFGADFAADERTFVMGIDRRFTRHFAERFAGLTVLETCTGGGFTTISLAETARHVYTVEIEPAHQDQARTNVETAGLSTRVTFVRSDILDPAVLKGLPPVEAAFLDPDWAVAGPDHVYRFRDSNTRPPADALLAAVLERTPNAALVLAPFVDVREFAGLPAHELERLYFGDGLELFCLYFGRLMRHRGETEFRFTS